MMTIKSHNVKINRIPRYSVLLPDALVWDENQPITPYSVDASSSETDDKSETEEDKE